MLVSCPLGSLCIGLMCTQRSGAGGRSFPGFDTDECQHCRCIEAADNPFMRCTTTVLSDENTPGIGLMGAVNFNLLAAAFALEHNMGFQVSTKICPRETRMRQNCYFRPVSYCGQNVLPVKFYDTSIDVGTRYGALYKRHAGNFSISDQDTIHTDKSRAAICSRLKNKTRNCYEDATGLQMWRAIAQTVLIPQPEIEDQVQNQYISQLTNSTGLRLDSTFAAMHIRWGDKRHGANRKSILDSVLPACAFSRALDKKLSNNNIPSNGMYVFVATDEARSIRDLLACPEVVQHDWHIVSLNEQHGDIAKGATAQKPPRRCPTCLEWDAETQNRLWAEIKIMVQAAFVVGQFRSNVDTVVQMLRAQEPETYVSLDDFKKVNWAPW